MGKTEQKSPLDSATVGLNMGILCKQKEKINKTGQTVVGKRWTGCSEPSGKHFKEGC